MQELAEIVYPYLTVVTLVMARMLTALIVLPLFSSQNLPRMVRASIAMALTLFMLPMLEPQAAGLTFSWHVIAMLLKEVGLGAILGFSFGMIFWAMENIGHLIDFQTGLTFTQTIDPLAGNQNSVHARLILQLFFVYFVAVGGLRLFLETMYASYMVWPVMTFMPHGKPGWEKIFSDQISLMFALTLLFSAPALILLLLVDFGFGLLNRAAPNMQVYDLVRPLKSWLATLVLVIMLPFILDRTLQIIMRYRTLLPLLEQAIG
ncbi:MAG: type III secretion system export apparatus subunit SctT [Pseudomonadota bacterium]